MVHAMATDRAQLPRVAWFLAVTSVATTAPMFACLACGPRVSPDRPFPEEGVVAKPQREPVLARGGRQVLVGELCPRGAAGRPAVAPLLLRTMGWTDATAEVNGAVERGSVPRFVA